MKILFYTGAAALSAILCVCASAQTPTPTPSKEPLPPGPLLVRMPDFSKWTITATDKSKTGSGTAKPNAGAAAAATKRDGSSSTNSVTTITKTMPIMLVSTVGSQADDSTIWCVGAFQVHQDAEFKKPTLLRAGGEAVLFVDFSRSDFPELAWLSPGNYVETLKSNDREYRIFRDKIPKTTEENISRARAKAVASKTAFDESAFYYVREACVDASTKLPAYWSAGTVYHVYKFENPPTETLTLPPDISSMIDREQKRLKDLARRPPAG